MRNKVVVTRLIEEIVVIASVKMLDKLFVYIFALSTIAKLQNRLFMNQSKIITKGSL